MAFAKGFAIAGAATLENGNFFVSESELYCLIGAIMEHHRKGLKLADFCNGKVHTVKVRFRRGEKRIVSNEIMNLVTTLRQFGALHQFIQAWRGLLSLDEFQLLQKGVYMEITEYTLQSVAPSVESQPTA